MSSSPLHRLFHELKRRKVFRVGAAYVVVAWVVLQVGDLVTEPLGLPPWTMTLLIVLAALGLPVALTLAWAYETTPSGVMRTDAPTTSEDSPESAHPSSHSEPAPGKAQNAHAQGEAAEDHSIAVLPFQNFSETEENAYFAAGIHDEILTQISKVEDLKVISRTSVMPYRETEKSVREIGRELGVRAILEGSVQRYGENIRVTAQLINAPTDEHLWADRFDRRLDDVFAIQTEIALAITRALHARLLPEEQRRIEKKPTEDTDGYRLYLQGRMHLDRRGKEDVLRSIDYFEQALERDSDFALSWAGLAEARTMLFDYGYATSDSVVAQSLEAAKRALELDPDLAEPHVTLGGKHMFRGDGPAALRELERAVELRPSYAIGHSIVSWVNLLLGRPDQAFESAHHAVELDPLGLEPLANLSMSYLIRGDSERALVEAQRMREITPDYATGALYEGVMLLHVGRSDEAAAVLDGVSVPWVGAGAEATRALAQVASGDAAAPGETLTGFEEAGEWFAAGLVHAALGDRERAFGAFTKVETWGGMPTGAWPTLSMRYLYGDVLDPLRNDPRFGKLLSEVNRSWGLGPDGSFPRAAQTAEA